jgi:LmbE family N-acetylglucosaminyl deacetylase
VKFYVCRCFVFVLLSYNAFTSESLKKPFMENKNTKVRTNVTLEECADSNKICCLGSSAYVYENKLDVLEGANVKRIFLLDSKAKYLEPFFGICTGKVYNIKSSNLEKFSFLSDDLIVFSEQSFLNKKIHVKGDPLVLVYEDRVSAANCYLPFTEDTINKKINSLKIFHLSQIERTPFDEIVADMSRFSQKRSTIKIQAVGVEDYFIDDKNSVSCAHIDRYKINEKDHVVIVAPHPDDAEIGCGGLLQYLGDKNIETTVIVATSGYRSVIKKSSVISGNFYSDSLVEKIKSCDEIITSSKIKTQIRQEESLNAILSLNSKAKVEFSNFSFYESAGYQLSQADKIRAQSLLEPLVSSGRLFVFMPNLQDKHAAHRKTTELFAQALSKSSHSQKYAAYYQTPWTGMWNIYHYNDKLGFSFSAQVGRELLLSPGQEALDLKKLGGSLAQRYFVTRYSKI